MGLHISNRWSSLLMEATEGLLIVGLERSAKFSHKSLTDDRFIIGPHRESLTVDRFKSILTELKFPAEHTADSINLFGESNQIGLGFEQRNGVSSYRLYFEFFNRYKPDPQLNSGTLHIGCKWQCGSPGGLTVTRYFFAPLFDGNNSEQIIRAIFTSVNKRFVDDIVCAVERPIALILPKHRIITCAAEEGSCRNSFDVNLYSSGEKVNFIEMEVINIAKFLKIENKDTDRFLYESGSADLGHISSGLDAMNNPFFTLYFDDFTQMQEQKNSINK